MRKDIKIELLPRTPEKSSGFYGNFINGLILLSIPIAAFYFEGTRRLDHEKKPENYIMLTIPYIVVAVVFWSMLSFTGFYMALVFSFLGFAICHVLIDVDVLKLRKGQAEFLLIPFLSVSLMTGVIMEELLLGTLLILFSTLLLILIIAMFIKKFPSPPIQKKWRNIFTGSNRTKNNHERVPPKGESVKSETTRAKANKKFCPHCGSSVDKDFGFCPKCGMNFSLLRRCSNCGVLSKVSDDSLFCPNCGTQKDSQAASSNPKKRLSLNRNKEKGFEKMS
jgi:RNA polymerase subunit RPABC4/transcription elongation factor Spt4